LLLVSGVRVLSPQVVGGGNGFVHVAYEDGAFEANKPIALVRSLTAAEKQKPRASLFGSLYYSKARACWGADYFDDGVEVPGAFRTPQEAELALLDYHQRGAKRRRDVLVLPTELMQLPTAGAAAANSVSGGGGGRRLLTQKERFAGPTGDEKSFLANAVKQRCHSLGFYGAMANANPEWRSTVPLPAMRCPVCLEEYGQDDALLPSSSSSSSSSEKRLRGKGRGEREDVSTAAAGGDGCTDGNFSRDAREDVSTAAAGGDGSTDGNFSSGSAVVSAGGAVRVGHGAYALRMKCCMNWFHVACTVAHAANVAANAATGKGALLQCPLCRDEKTYARQLRQVKRDLSQLQLEAAASHADEAASEDDEVLLLAGGSVREMEPTEGIAEEATEAITSGTHDSSESTVAADSAEAAATEDCAAEEASEEEEQSVFRGTAKLQCQKTRFKGAVVHCRRRG
jgi:hypothetical protein